MGKTVWNSARSSFTGKCVCCNLSRESFSDVFCCFLRDFTLIMADKQQGFPSDARVSVLTGVIYLCWQNYTYPVASSTTSFHVITHAAFICTTRCKSICRGACWDIFGLIKEKISCHTKDINGSSTMLLCLNIGMVGPVKAWLTDVKK